MIDYPLPLVGFAAFSGTGKTTLLCQLIPLLKAGGLRIGVVKHAHHQFEIDHPGKDSHSLRSAGAEQMLIASKGRIAWIEELPEQQREPTLAEVIGTLDPSRLDLVLVEGFKHEAFPKIELHRPALGRPLLYPNDPNIIAIATDTALFAHNLPLLDINRPASIADFIHESVVNTRSGTQPAALRLIHP